MTQILPNQNLSPNPLASPQPSSPITSERMGYGVLGLAVITFGLMALGSATRVMDAGLACPDWPLCFGAVVPADQMNLQVFLEWFHRLVASGVGLLTLGFAVVSWWGRAKLPKWLPSAALGAVALVALQGVLGGLTVTQFLKFEIVTAHLGTGLAFFCYLLTIALILLNPTPAYGWSRGAIVGGCAVALVYGQCLLGGLVASQWAVHQCLDSQELCSVITTHLLGIVPASLGALLVAIVGWHRLRKVSYGVLGLWLLQLLIGYSTYKLQLSVPALTVLHEAIGALLLASLVTFTALSARRVV